ncbi:MAG: alpha/beta hydrolase [Planctomycetota bacterium]
MTQRAELLRSGGQGPDLAYVPGIDGTGEFLLGTEARLGAGFRVHCLRYVDDTDDAPDSYPQLADTAAEALRAAGVASCLVLCESFGGGVALSLTLRHPDLVRGLGLVNTFAWYRRRLRLALSRLGAPLCPPPLFRLGRRLVVGWTLFGPMSTPEERRAFHALPGTFFDAVYRRRLRLIAGLDLRPRLPEVACPVTIFAAGQDQVVDSDRQGRLMASLLPSAELRTYARGRHLILPLAEIPWLDELRALDARARAAGR